MREKHITLFLVFALILIIGIFLYRFQDSIRSPEIDIKPEKTTKQLRLGLNIPRGTALHAAAERFADRVYARSKGEIQVSVHPNQELGNDNQMIEMARRGELAMILTPTAKFSTSVPSMQVLDLPFFFPSRERLYQALDGNFGKILLKKLNKIGLKGITVWENGFKHFTANRPIQSPSDFEGLKIRIMRSRILQDQFEAFGATTIPIDFHATRKALADGVVDGQENPLVAIVSMGFHEVQSHMTLSSHAYLGYVFSLSKKRLKTLSLNDQHILAETAQELTQWERKETKRREETLMTLVRKAGVKIHTLTTSEKKQFQKKLAHQPSEFESIIGADIISKAQEVIALGTTLDTPKNPPILIGLDADLSFQNAQSGLAIKQGVQLAIHEINQKGGILGRRLTLIARDHKGLLERGRNNIQFFAKQPNIVAIVGGKRSPVAIEELELIQRHNIPFLIPWASAQQLTENGYSPNYVFRVSLNSRLIAPFLVNACLQQGEHLALIFEDTLWGRENEKRMQSYLASLNKKPITSSSFRLRTDNFQKSVHEIISSQANCVLLIASPSESKSFLKTLFQLAPKMPIVSHWGLLGEKLTPQDKSLLMDKNIIFPQTTFLNPPTTNLGKQIMEKYQNFFLTNTDNLLETGSGFANAYDLIHLLVNAIQKAGSLQRPKIREALENLPPHTGLVKQYVKPFSPDNHDALSLEEYRLGRLSDADSIIPVHSEVR